MASIQVSDQLYKELEQIVGSSQEFKDPSAYVSYILEQVIAKKKQTATAAAPAASYSKEDEDKIRERLKNLGYLD